MSAICSPGGVERAVRRSNGAPLACRDPCAPGNVLLEHACSVAHCVIVDEGASRTRRIVEATSVRTGDVQDPAARRFATTLADSDNRRLSD